MKTKTDNNIDADAAAAVAQPQQPDDTATVDAAEATDSYDGMNLTELQSALNLAISSKNHAAILAITSEVETRQKAAVTLKALLKAGKNAAKETESTHETDYTAALSAAAAYIGNPSDETLSAFTDAADKCSEAPAAYTVRVSDHSIRRISREKRTNDSADERKALNETDLRAAELAAFLTGDDDTAATVKIGKQVKQVHPRAYLDSAHPTVCYYERDCPDFAAAVSAGSLTVQPLTVEAATERKMSAKQIAGVTDGSAKLYEVTAPAELVEHLTATKTNGDVLSAAQNDKVQTGSLQHGDAAARALVKLGMTDTAHTVRMNDGSETPVSDFIKAAVQNPHEAPDATETA